MNIMNTNMIESGGGEAIIDDKDNPDFVAGKVEPTAEELAAKAAEEAAEAGEAQLTEEEKAAAEAAKTPEEKQADIEAKIAEENKDKTPEEILALQEASRDTRTDEQKKADSEKAEKEAADLKEKEISDKALKALFDRHGVKSEAELLEKLNPKVETEEQKTAKQEVYTAALNKYAVENKVFTNDELSTLSNLKKMAPEELVFNQFKKDYSDLYKDRLDEDKKPQPVTDDEVRDKFNELYQIESEDSALKQKGAKNLELAAKSIIAPLEEKLADTKAVFDEENRKTAALPEYMKFVKSALADYVPKELTFGEGDNSVKVVLNNTDLAAIEQLFVKNHHFNDFLEKGGTEEQRAQFEKEIKKEIYYQNIDAIAKVVGDVRHGEGLKAGAIGAKKPFEEQKGIKPVVVDEDKLSQQEMDDIKKAFR